MPIEYSDYVEGLNDAETINGEEYVALSQFGSARKTPSGNLGVTREFQRAWSQTIVFDRNAVFYAPHVATGNITFQLGSGNLVDKDSVARQRITVNGAQSLNFGAGFDFLYGITNGQILAAGTYEIYFLHTNGSVVVNFPGVSGQSSGAVVLAPPGSFAAVADGETALDLSWTNISGNQGYLIEYSLTGSGGWTTLEITAVDAVASTQTGLSAGNTRYYRGKTLGNGSTTLDSAFSDVISGQTTSGGDVTDPVPTFLPANGNAVWPINKPLRITWNEPVQNADGSIITNANVASRMLVKQTNVGGANIGFSATVDGTKQIFDVIPTTHWGENQLVYWDVNNVEDVNNNDITTAISVTFTTTDFIFFNGTSNRLQFGDMLDSLFTVPDTNFWLELTVNNLLLSGSHALVTKYDTSGNQRCFQWYHLGTDVYFGFVGAVNGFFDRVIKWTNVLTSGEHILVAKLDMSIDTNDGLDRPTLLIDGVVQGSKSLASTNGIMQQSLPNATSQLAVGAFINSAGTPVNSALLSGEAKDFIVRSTGGTIVEINVPNLVTGLDISGNSRNGTWV